MYTILIWFYVVFLYMESYTIGYYTYVLGMLVQENYFGVFCYATLYIVLLRHFCNTLCVSMCVCIILLPKQRGFVCDKIHGIRF